LILQTKNGPSKADRPFSFLYVVIYYKFFGVFSGMFGFTGILKSWSGSPVLRGKFWGGWGGRNGKAPSGDGWAANVVS